jgi:GNAT superfamily N-acetyltransferase
VLTTDAPLAALNCISDFATTDARLDSTLDLGFALLRAFDRQPAVMLTPLDRPSGIDVTLSRRGLRIESASTWMTLGGNAAPSAANADVVVRVAGADDIIAFGNLHGGGVRWLRRLSKAAMSDGLLDPANTYYLGIVEGQPVATLHLLVNGGAHGESSKTGGIYAVGTMRTYRRRGVATALISRAVSDARAAGCDVIGLQAAAGGSAERLYARLGFVPAFESQLWVEPVAAVERIKIRRRRIGTRSKGQGATATA